jgi:regulator of cell morphogenesis and NO signaling
MNDPRTPRELVTSLLEKHARVRAALPWVGTLASKVAQVHGDKDPELRELARLVAELAAELPPHLETEDEVVFPPLAGGGEASDALDLAAMTQEHLAIGRLLEEIRLAADHFRSPEWACVTYRRLMSELADLEAEVLSCIHVENHTLARAAAV